MKPLVFNINDLGDLTVLKLGIFYKQFSQFFVVTVTIN